MMLDKVMNALETALNNWNAMFSSGSMDSDQAEETANRFEASFYTFIDALREWVYSMDNPPQTLDAFMELDAVKEMADQLPAPLYLNFETEAELIVERISRADEDKYD
ncbi:hypothetical protein [Paenibacillus aestuarii]|uniref:Uncharacterized protein n=1 Tax=Paenibacillus aestuarii TaxID=516965 RepID=A0ABW0KGK1_9BACL|nr:hypothetical protein [Paenibacillus aestuarii]